jgi:hypothetical protein
MLLILLLQNNHAPAESRDSLGAGLGEFADELCDCLLIFGDDAFIPRYQLVHKVL